MAPYARFSTHSATQGTMGLALRLGFLHADKAR
jgi:hypothetical protein